MAITLPLPSSQDERVFSARAKRLGVPVHEMLRYQGWEGVVVQELQEARQRLDDQFAGGEELILAIEAEADRVASARTSQAEAV